MKSLIIYLTLAEYTLGKSASYYLRTSNGWKELGMFLIGIVCILCFWMMLVFWEKLVKVISPHEPEQDKLFQELCSAHRLSKSESSYLRALITTMHIQEPGYVFINPQYLETYAKRGDTEAEQIRQKLFC